MIRRPGVLFCVLLVLAALPVGGTVLVRMDLDALVRHADRGIVHGTVLGVESEWNHDASMIFTWVEVLVIEGHSGRRRSGETMTFRIPGGRVGDFGVIVPGAPIFRPGEEVVVFASAWSDGPLMVLGYEQGLSRVRNGKLVGGTAEGLALEAFRGAVRERLPAGRGR